MAQQGGRRRRNRLLAIAGGLAALAIVALVGVYFLLFPTSSPKPLTLATPATSAPVSASTTIAGHWTVASGSVAGYRVREKLAFLPAQSDAVGRTSAITGGATLTESGQIVAIPAASFVIDVQTLKSDQSMRDQHIQTIGIQSATYPKATFVLTRAITLPAGATSGAVVHVPATGVFNIHGVSRTETVPLTMRLSSAGLEAVGSLTFPWGEFGMTAPSVGGFVSVTSTATMEFDLHLQRA